MEEQTPELKEQTDLEKLKAQNDEFEKELIRAREQRAEKQKLEAEVMLAGTSGAHIETQTPEMRQAAKAQNMADEIVTAFK